MMWNILTLVSCLMMLILFRRLDRSNPKITKLKRFSSKIFNDFRRLADTEGRRFNDATIEMDLLIKKASGLSSGLRESIGEIEERLNGLNIEKSNLKKVEDDLKIVSRAAQEVNAQIEFIAASRAGFNDITKKISILSEGMARLDRETSVIIQSFNDRMRERSREMGEEIAAHIGKLKDTISVSENDIIEMTQKKIEVLTRGFSDSLMKMEQNITTTGDAILDNVKLQMSSVENSVVSLEGRVDAAERKVFNDINSKIITLEQAIGDFSLDMQNSKEQSIACTRDEIAELSKKTANLKNTLSDLENTVFSEIREKTAVIKNDINESIEEFYRTKDTLMEKLNVDIEKVYNKLKHVEVNIDDSKAKLISSFEEEVHKIRTELDNLNIHWITKRDEIVKAARRESEEVKRRIDDFDEKYAEMENRLNQTADDKAERLVSEYYSIEQRFGNLADKLTATENQFNTSLSSQMENMKGEFFGMEQRIDSIRKEIIKYEESNQIFSRSDEMKNRVEDSLQNFGAMLKEAKEETRNIQKFMDDVEKIKDIRKTVEKEIRNFENRKNKLANFEHEITGLIEVTDLVTKKADGLEEKINRIDQVNARIDVLGEAYSNLESRITELQQYEDVITKNLESISKSDMLIKSTDSKLSSFQNVIDRSDKRIQKLTQYLQSIEENTLVLKSREQEIRDVKDKFNELEGLSEHIERRIEQIHAMFQKIETMRNQVDSTDLKLKEMFTQTDRKMKQFADFLQAVENSNPIARQLKGDISLGKNLNEGTIKAVRELSHKGWSSGEIAKKLLLDENSVRLIINTTTL